jgi:adenylate kinase
MAVALEYMRRGDLVPDSTVWEMVRERSGRLVVLDGFPGTLGYELPVAEIVSRLSGRRICEKRKADFHVTRQPSRSEGICDECGGTAVPTRR